MPPDKTRLLHGPYTTPAVHISDRVSCENRDVECVVTSITSGRIPWPRARG